MAPMSLLKRILGLSLSATRPSNEESESLGPIEARLAGLEPDAARYVASFAYVLARVAHADLDIADSEVAEIRSQVGALASLGDEEAGLVAEIARAQARSLGGTDNYTVTREFRRISSRAQRLQLLECLHAVAASDGSISTAESREILSIAEELGLTRQDVNAVRAGWRQHLATLQGLPRGSP